MPYELKIYLFTEYQLEEILIAAHKAGFMEGWNSAECTYPPDSSFIEISKRYADDVIKEIRESDNNENIDPPWARGE